MYPDIEGINMKNILFGFIILISVYSAGCGSSKKGGGGDLDNFIDTDDLVITGMAYYVATDGDNGNDGSEDFPWETISYAVSQPLFPGDGVIVKPGTYTEQITVAQSGSAEGGYIIIRSQTQGGAVILPPGAIYSTINITADYVIIDGFDVQGGDGHAVDGEGCHHSGVFNCIAHDSGGSGISFARSEYITIQNNVAYGNAGTNGYQCSGISVYQCRNLSGDTEYKGFRTVIRGNISYNNVETAAIGGEHTDGNGIIIDDFQHTQAPTFPNYTYPTLVENNLVYGNGGKGIQVTWSDYVTVRNNTAWHNNIDNLNAGTWRGELSNAQSSNNTWVNNIGVADPGVNADNTAIGNYSYGGYENEGTAWYCNITFNGTPGEASYKTDGGNAAPDAAEGNQLGVDPELNNAGTDFRTDSDSPGTDAGTDEFGLSPLDLDGNPRAVNTVDIGAYEVQ